MAKRVKGIKTGRRAGQDDRQRARELIELYQLAQDSSDGRYCLNPGNEPEDQAFIEYTNPDFLLSALAGFAEHGTFINMDFLIVRNVEMHLEFEALRPTVQNNAEAIEFLANKHNASVRTIERRLRVGPLTKYWPRTVKP